MRKNIQKIYISNKRMDATKDEGQGPTKDKDQDPTKDEDSYPRKDEDLDPRKDKASDPAKDEDPVPTKDEGPDPQTMCSSFFIIYCDLRVLFQLHLMWSMTFMNTKEESSGVIVAGGV